MSRPYTTNASDRGQQRRIERLAKRQEQRYIAALAASLQHPEVRYVVSVWLERAGLMVSSFDHSGSLMNFKEGQRSFGLELLADCERADERAADTMELERRARKRAEQREVDAWHTPSTTEEERDGSEESRTG
jgi:hypothetical protein